MTVEDCDFIRDQIAAHMATISSEMNALSAQMILLAVCERGDSPLPPSSSSSSSSSGPMQLQAANQSESQSAFRRFKAAVGTMMHATTAACQAWDGYCGR